MNDHRHLLRLWLLGTFILMATLGSLGGATLRQLHDNPILPHHTPLLALGGLMAIGLLAVWFRNGHRLWEAAARAR